VVILKNNINEYRKKYGFSQDKLAEKLGVSRQTIISIEKGKYNPSLPLAMMIAELFQTTVENIFFLEKEDYK
jgi:putative transcriptional regulator